jgi:hypothetical protein
MHTSTPRAKWRDAVVRMQLWGFGVIGDLTVTVQEEARFLQKKFQKKSERAKLSSSRRKDFRTLAGKRFFKTRIRFCDRL